MIFTVLKGIVGSKAYGLDDKDSDTDYLGVFVEPTFSYWNLTKPLETHVSNNPDTAMHEMEKFLRLAVKCNPTILELLYLPDHLYVNKTEIGEKLIQIRNKFLSTKAVDSAYFGYANRQYHSGVKGASLKKLKHAFRLLDQGISLKKTGILELEVKNMDFYHNLACGYITNLDQLFSSKCEEFKAIDSVLPDQPDLIAINQFLWIVRNYFLPNSPFLK